MRLRMAPDWTFVAAGERFFAFAVAAAVYLGPVVGFCDISCVRAKF